MLCPSQLQPVRPDFDNLIDALVLGTVKAILLCDCRRDKPGSPSQPDQDGESADCRTRYVPAADKVTPLEVFSERFGRRQADKHIRMKVAADPRLGRTLFDIPGGWSVDRRDRNLGFGHGLYDCGERFPDLAREAEACGGSVGNSRSRRREGTHERGGLERTKDGIDDVIS